MGEPGPIDRYFKLVFLSVLVITVLCLGGAVYLSLGAQSEPVKETTTRLWTLVDAGFGAILGLLGGKAL